MAVVGNLGASKTPPTTLAWPSAHAHSPPNNNILRRTASSVDKKRLDLPSGLGLATTTLGWTNL